MLMFLLWYFDRSTVDHLLSSTLCITESGMANSRGRRKGQRLILFYKIVNTIASIQTDSILTPSNSRTRANHIFKFDHVQVILWVRDTHFF